MQRPPLWWLWDLDDTLMWNENTYNPAVVEFVYYLTAQFGNRIPFIGSIAKRQEEITFAMLKETNPRTEKPYGFSCDRFPDSLARTYKELCENGWGNYDEAVAEQCREIGRTAFDEANYRRLGLVPGAQEVLDQLTANECNLVLVTKGDRLVQHKKIGALNLTHWFPWFTIVDQKTPATYLEMLSGADPATAAVVGNSFSSDIRPALDAGIGACILIPCATWKAESVDTGKLTDGERSRLITMKTIGEIIPWYKSLSK